MKSVPSKVSQDGVRLTQPQLSSNVMCNGRKDILNGRSALLLDDDMDSQIHPSWGNHVL